MTHFDRPHGISYAGHATRVREKGGSSAYPPNSPESMYVARMLWHKLNPGREYPTITTMDVHRHVNGDQLLKNCAVCGEPFRKHSVASRTIHCAPCRAVKMQMKGLIR